MGSRNGLNPKIREKKGVGYGRALPAAFGFGNGLVPPGTSGSILSVLNLVGKTWPVEGTIEMWQLVPSERDGQTILQVGFSNGSSLILYNWDQIISLFGGTGHIPTDAIPPGIYSLNTKHHVAYSWDETNAYAWGNSVLPNSFNVRSLSNPFNLTVSYMILCARADGSNNSSVKMDELRFYNRKLPITELVQNDANGAGANPTITEGLFAWYQFENFEMLDFSEYQDNSDLRLGIRDMSGNNNHAWVQNMDTDPSSSTYVLKPF